MVVTRSKDTTARVWCAKTGKLLYVLSGHTGPLTSVVFSPDGKTVITGSEIPPLAFETLQKENSSYLFRGHTKDGLCRLHVALMERMVLTGSWDATACLWNAKTGEQLQILKGHKKAIKFSSV